MKLKSWHQIAIADEFVAHGDAAILRDLYDLSKDGIIREVLRKNT